MLNIDARCNGAFIGHAIASNYDPSISMAATITDSLVEHNKFDESDILSRYLYMYHTERSEIGETTKSLYQLVLNNIQNTGNQSSISRQDFLLDQSIINEYVKITDKNLNGHTAGCGPAQRSFPLALCSRIADADVFELSMKEAALTHYNPLAGQVAGIVNLICRSLLKNKSWHDAVQSAFTMPRLHDDVLSVYNRYSRSAHPFVETHMAYAPTVLNAALNYVSSSRNAADAIEKARRNGQFYCVPIVGILSGALWGVPQNIYANKVNDATFITIRRAASKLSSQWPSHYDSVTN